MKNLAWIVGILGLWLIVAAFLGFGENAAMWNNLLVGIVVAIVGYNMLENLQWQNWVSMIVGIWLIISAFIPDLRVGDAFMWNAVITGILVAISGFGLIAEKGTDTEAEPATG